MLYVSTRACPDVFGRDNPSYERRYFRARRQPFWSLVGLVGCSALILTSGWTAIYQLASVSNPVINRELAIEILGSYLGVRATAIATTAKVYNLLILLQPVIFCGIYLAYKITYGTQVRTLQEIARGLSQKATNQGEVVDPAPIRDLLL
jgi:amino acid permease